jgi:hypothetical protein
MTEEVDYVLDPASLDFAVTDGGVLSLRIGEKYYPRVHAYRGFPVSNDRIWISLRDAEDVEIGIIDDLDRLPESSRQVLLDELDRRYFSPVIDRIHSLTEEFGYTYWDVSTEAGRTRFTVQSGQQAAVQLDDRILISDVEGNRFEIRDLDSIGTKHRRIVELLM